ncbi:hypothetical protein ABOM_002674 [Aspergillus bombycis]|uniref:Uncharacterized protein n=1 Tax=Aspergillus bombycis TaxID=109264 RepID=A0A1F8A8I1_9EURO|nr:hypothetical protein ABOM_002674 [Aspergillus bombycis]OGM48024.1 hypothetical protein ABOM_002674 [Aspergillus bombycis]
MPSLLYVSSVFLATSSATVTYLYFLHRSLGHRIHHEFHQSELPESVSTIVSLPAEVSRGECRTFYDHASRRVARKLLPAQRLEDLFSLLLRRNMTAFSRFPQAWILRLTVAPADRITFHASHIRSLQFKEGDLVCGLYRVQERTPNKAVLELLFNGEVSGRLIIRFWEEGEDVVFCTETIMWTSKVNPGQRKRAIVPLENPVLRFLHEMAAWWLIDSGVKYLLDLKGNTQLLEGRSC